MNTPRKYWIALCLFLLFCLSLQLAGATPIAPSLVDLERRVLELEARPARLIFLVVPWPRHGLGVEPKDEHTVEL